MTEVDLTTVAPGLAPGGLWVRIVAGNVVIGESAMTDAMQAVNSAVADGTLVKPYLDQGVPVFNYFYDGDTGQCLLVTGAV